MRHDVVEPATETVLSSLLGARPEDVDEAVEWAHKGQRQWQAPAERARVLDAIADGIERYEVRLPEGALGVLVGTGEDVGQRIVEHPGVGKIAFTGSTVVGRSIAAKAAQSVKRVTLELGGKSSRRPARSRDGDGAADLRPPAPAGRDLRQLGADRVPGLGARRQGLLVSADRPAPD